MAAGRRINKGNYDMKRFVMLLRLEIKKYRKGFPGLLLSVFVLEAIFKENFAPFFKETCFTFKVTFDFSFGMVLETSLSQ